MLCPPACERPAASVQLPASTIAIQPTSTPRPPCATLRLTLARLLSPPRAMAAIRLPLALVVLLGAHGCTALRIREDTGPSRYGTTILARAGYSELL